MTERNALADRLESGELVLMFFHPEDKFAPIYASDEQNKTVLNALRQPPSDASSRAPSEEIDRAMDLLGDVPGETLCDRVERLVSYHLGLQAQITELKAAPAAAPTLGREAAIDVLWERHCAGIRQTPGDRKYYGETVDAVAATLTVPDKGDPDDKPVAWRWKWKHISEDTWHYGAERPDEGYPLNALEPLYASIPVQDAEPTTSVQGSREMPPTGANAAHSVAESEKPLTTIDMPWLLDAVDTAKLNRDESKAEDANSYGSGYDSGYYDALCVVLENTEQVAPIMAKE